MLDLKTHLKTLVEAHGPSGHEGPIREIMREAWDGLVDEMQEDGLGSLIGIKHGTQPLKTPRKIMLAAHMDEIAYMVRDIEDGFLYIHRINGIDNRVMLAQPVLVHGKRPLPGVIASTPPHLLSQEERKKYPSHDNLLVDVGLPAAEVEQIVRIGDLVTVDVPMLDLQGKLVAGKAMDDRACIAAITACLDALQGMQHSWDVYATATVQEENGLNGARVSAFKIAPDIAIALDVTFAPQPGVDDDDTSALSSGPALGIGPNFYPKLWEKIQEVAKQHEIKLQEGYIPGASGTDAWAIQIAREGIPSALLGLPLKNMHSPIEIVDLQDIERTGRLLAQFIASLDENFMSAIEWDDLKQKDGVA